MSSKIQLRQSSIVINKYTLCDMPQLEYMFSLWNDITFSSYFKGMEYKEDTQQLILPRGIDVPMLENMFQSYASIDRNVDKYDHIEPSKMKYMPRDDIQKRAIAFMYGVKEYDFTKDRKSVV